MIQSIDISGVKYQLEPDVVRYVRKKIGRLDRFLPRHARKSVTAHVRLKEVNKDHGNKYEAEVILHVPDKQIEAHDTTLNMFAAIDIVEAKMASQLKKYKQAHLPHGGRTRVLISRLKRRA